MINSWVILFSDVHYQVFLNLETEIFYSVGSQLVQIWWYKNDNCIKLNINIIEESMN